MSTFTIITIALMTPVFSVEFVCETPTDCVDPDMTTNGSIYAFGYKSAAKGGHLTATGDYDIYCDGAYSCEKVLSISQTYTGMSFMQFDGTGSAQNVSSIYGSTARAFCSGANSCSYSYISTNYAHCDGDQSCSYSTIDPLGTYSTMRVRGFGAYSLKNATIDSINSDGSMRVEFYGYHSAFGTLVICQDGDACNIFCYANACEFLKTQCPGYTDSKCPITYYYKAPRNETHDIILLYDSLSLTTTNNMNCDEGNSLSYDNYDEFRYQNDVIVNVAISPHFCCRGSGSCGYNDKITYNGSIVCSAAGACLNTGPLQNSGDLFCEGRQSCRLSIMNSPNIRNIYCFGYDACEDATISGVGNIYCSGRTSCYNTNITSYGNGGNLTIYLLGYESFSGIDIYCKINDFCRIIVGGDSGGRSANSVICDGECVVECPITYRNCPIIMFPTSNPTSNPTSIPTSTPTVLPTIPTIYPTFEPTKYPTLEPTVYPTIYPTLEPTLHPTVFPTIPTIYPTFQPTKYPTLEPTVYPTFNPTLNPTQFTQRTTWFMSTSTSQQYVYGVVITLTFEYVNGTLDEINEILIYMIQNEITKFDNESYCILTDFDAQINPSTDRKATTTVTIQVCNENVQETLWIKFRDTLSKDFILNEINHNSILIVVIEDIEVELEISEIYTSTKSIEISEIKKNDNLETWMNEHLLLIYVGIPVFILLIVLIIIVGIYYKRKNSVSKEIKNDTTHINSIAMTEQQILSNTVLSASDGEVDEEINDLDGTDDDLYENHNIQETKGCDDNDTDSEKDEDLYKNSDIIIQNTKGEEKNDIDEDLYEEYDNIQETKECDDDDTDSQKDEDLYKNLDIIENTKGEENENVNEDVKDQENEEMYDNIGTTKGDENNEEELYKVVNNETVRSDDGEEGGDVTGVITSETAQNNIVLVSPHSNEEENVETAHQTLLHPTKTDV